MMPKRFCLVSTILLATVSFIALAQQTPPAGPPPQPTGPMSFFVTSHGPGDGANLGGLVGADAHCQSLAESVGAGQRTWRAYLSAAASDSETAVNARDRIGSGPWFNAKEEQIASSVDTLHGDTERDRNNFRKDTALNEKGEVISGRGDTPNRHDILTGSNSEGRLAAGTQDMTCANWTSNSPDGGAMVGHSDRVGAGNTSWNSAHRSRGCSQENLQSTGGDGLFYCFAE